MPKGAKAQNNFATTSMPSLPVVPLYPPSSTNSNSSPAMTAPPLLTPTSNTGTAHRTPAPLPPIITKTISNPTSGPTTPSNIPPIPSFALPDKSLPIAALKNPSLAKVIQSGSAGSASDHPSSQSAVSSQLSVASPSLTSHPSTSSSDTVKPIKENSYTHSVDPRLIDSVRSDDSDSEEEYTTSDDESSSDSDEYSDDDDQGYLRVPVKDNWDELQSTLSEVSDSDDEGEVAILSSQVLKQTKEDSDSEDSDDEVSLNHSKGSSGKLKKSQTKKPHERNPSMGGGVFEMELSDAKKGIQYKLKSADDEGDFSGVNVVETTCGKHEYYNLKCIYVRGRTGFEESRDFPIRLHDVIAGRYEIIEYLGSAAFSRAVQCLDHMTGQMVCVKIIKNNKDFFDQSLDEIKLLKYIKANGDTEENHVIKMLDHFYYKEHLFIVCELLRENLYEFYKYNRESGEEIYFTLPRIQKVARQVLCALKYIHSLGLIHCDLKPENVLMRSYSRCEVKVIDFGSSCFLTDHLSTYVQSRSYRAPEVILGMPYDQRIDIWSLGCILAELYTGKVLFQNDSVQTLLARLVGIMGQLDRKYLKRGKYSAKYFTKNYTVLYDKKNGAVEYLYPKKSSLRRRLKTDDALFLDFMTRLLKVNARERPTAEEALEHPFLKFDFEKFPQGTKLT
jgi:serine/threonine protein kinase